MKKITQLNPVKLYLYSMCLSLFLTILWAILFEIFKITDAQLVSVPWAKDYNLEEYYIWPSGILSTDETSIYCKFWDKTAYSRPSYSRTKLSVIADPETFEIISWNEWRDSMYTYSLWRGCLFSVPEICSCFVDRKSKNGVE